MSGAGYRTSGASSGAAKRRGLLFSITTFVVFLAVFSFSAFIAEKTTENVEFLNKLSAANTMFYLYDSLEYGTRRIELAYGPNMTLAINTTTNSTNFTLAEHLPADYSDDVLKFHNFVKQRSYLNISTTSTFNKYVVSPYNLTVENTNSGIVNTFLNTTGSVGQLESIRLDIYATDTVTPIQSDDALLADGVNLFIYVHTNAGQERTYNKTLDPNKQTNISIHIAYGPPQPPRSSHEAFVTFGPVGKLNVTLESGLEFDYVQSIILQGQGKVNINSFSSINVNHTAYGVSKNSSVSVII
jgi:hypothetical protein